MKAFLAILLIAGAMQAAPALASSSSASPLLGSWAVDTSRLPAPAAARPKAVTITFREAGAGKWATRVERDDANGAKAVAEGLSPLDGTPGPVTGNLEADLAAAKLPAPNVLILQLAKSGTPVSTRIYTVAADSKSMTETVAYFGQDGRPMMRTNYFTRIR